MVGDVSPIIAATTKGVYTLGSTILAVLSLLRVQEWEIDLLSLLHFVSRIKLPDYMFEKEGKLSEFEFVQEHCYMAKELCEGIPDFQEVEKSFLYHHEKVDGTGYPYCLGGSIPCANDAAVLQAGDVPARSLCRNSEAGGTFLPRGYRRDLRKSDRLASNITLPKARLLLSSLRHISKSLCRLYQTTEGKE
ncbi:HD-GYP domain-containing protein [Paenibacillus aceris]|uniref:HD domain-containing protein n=1 Tax=Paenibacillus aceris TaxID=869555 RepID=A0ABS4I2Z5_9BACL|nr:HD domain-containing phosphohydrolase [Paenibacillus aceris]MBP1964806.1 hypothetical protein [Paenibacillus aceris]NHW33784.1 hypothetical protein [Paenibacillus aceris]